MPRPSSPPATSPPPPNVGESMNPPTSAMSPTKMSPTKNKAKHKKDKKRKKNKHGGTEDDEVIIDLANAPLAPPQHHTTQKPEVSPQQLPNKDATREDFSDDESETTEARGPPPVDPALEAAQRTRLSKLEASLLRKKDEIATLRSKVENSHRLNLDKAAAEHEDTLKRLDKEIKDSRATKGDIGEKLGSMQRAAQEGAALEIEFDRQVWEIERDYLLDDLVLKRMELDKVKNKGILLGDLQMERLAAVDAIEEERDRRRFEQDNKLAILLGRIPHMQGVLTVDHELTTRVMGDYGEDDDGRVVYKLGDELNKVRKEEYEKWLEMSKSVAKKLAEEKVEKEERLRILEGERKKLDRITTRGNKYLVAMELDRSRDPDEDDRDFDVAGVVELDKEVRVGLMFKGLKEDIFETTDDDPPLSEAPKLFDEVPEEPASAAEDSPEASAAIPPVPSTPPVPQSPPPTPPSLATPDYKSLLTAFYTQYNKEKLPKIDSILKNSKKIEAQFEKLAKQYNTENPLVKENERQAQHNKALTSDYNKSKAEYDAAQAAKAATQLSPTTPATTSPPPPTTTSTPAPAAYTLPPHLALLSKQVEILIPRSQENLGTLETEIEQLESEVTWVLSTKPSTWEDSSSRLHNIDEEAARTRRIALTNEFTAFDDITDARNAVRHINEQNVEIHQVAIALQKEVIEEAIRGVWMEVNRLTKFARRTTNTAIFDALSDAHPDDPSNWRSSMWFGALLQLQKDRDKLDSSGTVDKDTCPASSCFSDNFITDDDLDGKKKRRNKQKTAHVHADYKMPNVSDFESQSASVSSIDKIPEDDKFRASPARIAALAKLEKEFWSKAKSRRVLIDLPKKQGGVSKVSLSMYKSNNVTRVMIAAGTTKGGIMVYSLDPKLANAKPQLVRFLDASNLPKKEQSPINSLQFSLDGSSQLITLDENKVVRLWHLEAESSQGKGSEHTRDAFAKDPSKYTPAIPSMSLTLTSENFHRPPFMDASIKATVDKELEAKGGGGFFGGGAYVPKPEEQKKIAARYSWKPDAQGLQPSVTRFHPSLTMLATQPSLMVGLEDGILVRWNNVAKVPGQTTVAAKNVVYGRSLVPTEPADPAQKDAEKMIFNVDFEAGSCVQREFYEFHKAAIVCVHFVNNVQLDMVSVDETGWLAMWTHEEEDFSGHNWFTPCKKVKLDFGTDPSSPIKIIDVQPSISGGELFFLIADGSKDLKIYVFELTTLQFLPEHIVHRLHRKYVVAPTMAVSPLVASSGSDYIYLTVSGEVFIYSVATGQEVMVDSRKFRPDEVEGAIIGVNVGVSGDVLVYETPETVKNMIVEIIDFSPCWGEGEAETLRRKMGELRLPRWLSGERSLMIIPESSLWEEDLGAEDLLEVLRGLIDDCTDAAILVSGERKKAEVEAKKAASAKEKAEKEVAKDIFLTFLGDDKLGTVEPVSLEVASALPPETA